MQEQGLNIDCQELSKKDISLVKTTLKSLIEDSITEKNVHGKNILEKIKRIKAEERNKTEVLYEAIKRYITFLTSMNEGSLRRKIKDFIHYREYIRNINRGNNGKLIFSSQSKFESTIIEEFLYHLFKDFEKEEIEVGSIKAYTSLYFSARNFEEFKTSPDMKINEKNQDFAIYRKFKLELKNKNSETLHIKDIALPIITIECKTYLDKTMLEGSIATAEKIKIGNPHCKFFILTEAYDVKYEVDIATSRIDNIFVLRKGKTSENNPIDGKVIVKLFKAVKYHLESDWENIENNIKKYGLAFLESKKEELWK